MIIHYSKLLIKGKKKDGLFLHSPSPMEKGRYCIAKPGINSTSIYQYIKAEHGYIDDLLLQKLKLMKSLAYLSFGEGMRERL